MAAFFTQLKAWCLSLFIASSPYAEDFRQSFPISGNFQLMVENHNGSVEVASHAEQDVVVTATISNSKQPITSKIVCNQATNNGLTCISCTTQSEQSMFGQSDEVKYTILSPKSGCQQTDIQVHNGQIMTNAISGTQYLRTHNGSIEVQAAQADLDAQTHNGTIVVSNAQAPFNVQTHNGAITVSVASKIAGDCGAKTHNGLVTIVGSKHIAGTLDATTKNGYKSIL